VSGDCDGHDIRDHLWDDCLGVRTVDWRLMI
jgi:hypothetical protein